MPRNHRPIAPPPPITTRNKRPFDQLPAAQADGTPAPGGGGGGGGGGSLPTAPLGQALISQGVGVSPIFSPQVRLIDPGALVTLAAAPGARQYRFAMIDGAGAMILDRDDEPVGIALRFATNQPSIGLSTPFGDLALAINGGDLSIVSSNGGGAGKIQLGRRHADSSTGVGARVEVWTATGQLTPPLAVMGPGGAPILWMINPAGRMLLGADLPLTPALQALATAVEVVQGDGLARTTLLAAGLGNTPLNASFLLSGVASPAVLPPVTGLTGYPGGTALFLRADATFAAPVAVAAPHAVTHEPGGTDPMTVDAAPATGSLRTLGAGANQAAPGNDPRFAAGTAAHAPTHETGGSDPITNISGGIILSGTVADARLSANVPLKNAANIFTADQRISKAIPELTFLHSGTAMGRVGSGASNDVRLQRNMKFDGTNFVLDDTALPGMAVVLNSAGNFNIQQATAGANPRSPTNVFSVDPTGAIFERARTTALGDWVAVPFNAANFSGQGGMTWTVASGAQDYIYMLFGKTLTVSCHVNPSTLGGTIGPILLLGLPPGLSAARLLLSVSFIYFDPSNVAHACYAYTQTIGSTQITIIRVDALNFVAGGCRLYGQMMIHIQ